MKNPQKITRITVRAAALVLREHGVECTEDMIGRWCRTGVLKKAKKIGGQWYVNKAEVESLVEDQETASE